MLVVMLVVLTLGFVVLAAVVIVLLLRFTGLRTEFVRLHEDAAVNAGLAEGQLELDQRLSAERDALKREDQRLAERLAALEKSPDAPGPPLGPGILAEMRPERLAEAERRLDEAAREVREYVANAPPTEGSEARAARLARLAEEIAIPPEEQRETPVPVSAPVAPPAEGGTISASTHVMMAALQVPSDARTTRLKVAAPSDEDLAAARAGRTPGPRRAARPTHLAPPSRRPPPPVAPAPDAPPPILWNAALPPVPAAWAPTVAPPPPATTNDDDDSADETQILLSSAAIDAVLAAQPPRKGTLLGLAPTTEPPPPSKGAT